MVARDSRAAEVQRTHDARPGGVGRETGEKESLNPPDSGEDDSTLDEELEIRCHGGQDSKISRT
jgi:hypothetical protein